MPMEVEIARKTIFEGTIITVRIDRVRLPNGKEATREVVSHPGAVAALAVTPEKKVLLVEQFRKPIEKNLLEAPAGKLEPNESIESCVKRELAEETGYHSDCWIPMGSIFTTAGFSDEKIWLFLALNAQKGEAQPDEDEFLSVHTVDWGWLMHQAETGGIEDAKTLALLIRAKVKVEAYFDDIPTDRREAF